MIEYRRDFFDCECVCHAVSVFSDRDPDMPFIAVEWWVNGNEGWSLRERLRYAWEILRWGKVHVREVVLSPETARAMGELLIEVAKEVDKSGVV